MEKKIERMMYIERQSQTDNRSAQRGFCPVRLMQKIMEGKWKFIILYYLMLKPTRFNELQRLIPNISHGVLTTQLKEDMG